MPIRPENRAKYPWDWKRIAAEVKVAAGGRCEACGLAHGAFVERGVWRALSPVDLDLLHVDADLIRVVLTVAHLDHDPRNCNRANLKAWCQRCHNRYDAPHRAAGIRARRRARRAAGDLFPTKEGKPGEIP